MPAMVLAEVGGRWPSGWGPGAGTAPPQAGAAFPAPLLFIHRGSPSLLGRRSSLAFLEVAGCYRGERARKWKTNVQIPKGKGGVQKEITDLCILFHVYNKKILPDSQLAEGRKEMGILLEEGSFSELVPEEQRQLVCVGSLLAPKAWAFLGH